MDFIPTAMPIRFANGDFHACIHFTFQYLVVDA